MKNNCYQKRFLSQVPIYSTHQAHSTEKVVVDGHVVSRSIYVVDDPRELYRDVKAFDYYLENLLDAGSDLKHCVLSASSFTAVASMPILTESNVLNSSADVSSTEKS